MSEQDRYDEYLEKKDEIEYTELSLSRKKFLQEEYEREFLPDPPVDDEDSE